MYQFDFQLCLSGRNKKLVWYGHDITTMSKKKNIWNNFFQTW